MQRRQYEAFACPAEIVPAIEVAAGHSIRPFGFRLQEPPVIGKPFGQRIQREVNVAFELTLFVCPATQ